MIPTKDSFVDLQRWHGTHFCDVLYVVRGASIWMCSGTDVATWRDWGEGRRIGLQVVLVLVLLSVDNSLLVTTFFSRNLSSWAEKILSSTEGVVVLVSLSDDNLLVILLSLVCSVCSITLALSRRSTLSTMARHVSSLFCIIWFPNNEVAGGNLIYWNFGSSYLCGRRGMVVAGTAATYLLVQTWEGENPNHVVALSVRTFATLDEWSFLLLCSCDVVVTIICLTKDSHRSHPNVFQPSGRLDTPTTHCLR